MTEEDAVESGGRWFHCGHCGHLFEQAAGRPTPVVCRHCGRDPVVDDGRDEEEDEDEEEEVRPPIEAKLTTLEAASAAPSAGAVGRSSRSSRSSSRRGKRRASPLMWVVGGWLVGLVLLVLVIRGLGSRGAGDEVAEEAAEATASQRVAKEAYVECQARLVAFLKTRAPEQRVAHVLDPVETLGKVLRFRDEGLTLAGDAVREPLLFRALETPAGSMIESLWLLKDERRLEVAYRPDEDGVWKIDWEHLMRFSSADWALFLAGIGPDEGEFRLLVRRRGGEPKEAGAPVTHVVLVAPRVGEPEKFGAQSPAIEVDPESRIGRILNQAFERRREGMGAYGSAAVAEDPLGTVRVRVKVRRGGDVEREFAIQDIVATHWYGFEDLGLD